MPEDEKPNRLFYGRDLNQVLSGLLKTMTGADANLLTRIKTDWHLIAGENIARLVKPVKIVQQRDAKAETVLHVLVEEGFALEFQYSEGLLLEKIAVYFGYKAVGKIRAKTFLPAKIGEAKLPERELTGQEKAEVSNIAGIVEDEPLQEALKKLGAAIFSKN